MLKLGVSEVCRRTFKKLVIQDIISCQISDEMVDGVQATVAYAPNQNIDVMVEIIADVWPN